ncbi:DUF1572 domain-containing protein [Lutimonas saemankumensis]|uniref:DUF1572 domain-containing protein n=1 Tax=Lutimonas saemankumensis TaxID=483016 RepID=UPI001CD51936|nr:DUF1572 domain-containing protein [Lutimonas saemankumensis]MCA0933450.1 DUF1572 domain-containing protein [Lutimonas saemankumensis]
MALSKEIARQIREMHFGSNWTGSSLKDQLQDLDWKKATISFDSLNSIALLIFHSNYYIDKTLYALKYGKLEAHDKFSFDLPTINSDREWQDFLSKVWGDAEEFAAYIEKMPDEKLWEIMIEEKYGTYYRNFLGIIEHFHYHLGQITLLKKLIKNE